MTVEEVIQRLRDVGDESVKKLDAFIATRTDWLYATVEEAEKLVSKPKVDSFPRTPKLTRRKGKRKEEFAPKISRKSSLSKKIKLESLVEAVPEKEPSSNKELSPEIELELSPEIKLDEISQNRKSEKLSVSRQSIRRSLRLSCKNRKRKSSIIHLKPIERVNSSNHSFLKTRYRSRGSISHGKENADSVIHVTNEEEIDAISNIPSAVSPLNTEANTRKEETRSSNTKHSISVKTTSPMKDSKVEIISDTPSPNPVSKVEIISDTPPPNPVSKLKTKQTLNKSGKRTCEVSHYGRTWQAVSSSTSNLRSKKIERVPSISKSSYINPAAKKSSLTPVPSISKSSYINPAAKKTSLTPVIKTTRSFVMSAPSLKRHSPRIKVKETEGLEDIKRKLRRKSEICKKRDELLKQKIEEHKRKREERERRVQEAREQRQRDIEEQNRLIEKEREERQNAVEKTKVEKLKKETKKRSQRNKQKKEAEERRKKEEEARLAKLKELEEEQQRYQLMLERKKDFELQQKRLAQKEKEQIELEEKKQREIEEKKQRELEEKKRRQQLKESERLKEQERVAREKAELERIQETERRAKEEMERKKLQKEVSSPIVKSEKLNTTFNKEDVQSYMITPDRSKAKKKLIDPENYDIGDLSSGDSTDNDSNPRKPIPNWAQGKVFSSSIIFQTRFPPNLDEIFPTFDIPDLCEIFKSNNRRYLKRTSSAVWTSPIQKHNQSFKKELK